jgi:3-dehydroquinate synthase
MKNGAAEMIKHAVIRDEKLFSELEQHIGEIIDPGSSYDMAPLIAANCRIKADVVMQDETEGGLRKILNFGHTVGHAVETLSEGRLNHGEAVAAGMSAECAVACGSGMLDSATADRIRALIQRAGLPARIPCGMRTGDIMSLMLHDKKAEKGIVTFALPDRIGSCSHGVTADEQTLRTALEESAEA